MTYPSQNELSLERKVMACHCGASSQWSTVLDLKDFSWYHVCPRCLCNLQKLSHDENGNPIWITLPENLGSCPRIGKMRKCYLLIMEWFTKMLQAFKRFLHGKEATPQELDRLLKQGWRLRRKKIKGRLYAYLQLGREYRYVGPWKQEYENK